MTIRAWSHKEECKKRGDAEEEELQLAAVACRRRRSLASYFFPLPGFLIQLRFIIPPQPRLFFEVDLIYFSLFLFIYFTAVILDRRGGALEGKDFLRGRKCG